MGERFNKQTDVALREKKPSVFKVLNFIKRCDSNMTRAAHDYGIEKS